MENQVNKLKLNVTNIKSYLIKSNKELRTIRIQKSNLLSNIGKQTQIKQKETKIESKSTSDNIFSRFVGAITQPARSIFDRILDFLGLIGLGILVQSLPKILKQIDDFFNSDFMKTVGAIFNSIGFGFQKLGELINLLTPQKRNELDSDLKFIEKEVDENSKLADQADKDISEFDKLLKEKEGNNQEQSETQSPQQPAQNTPSQSPISPAQNTPSQSPTSPAQNTPSQSPTSTPPAQISQPEKPEKFSSGGTVRGGNTPQQSQSTARTSYQPKKSGQLKRAESGANQGFNQFSLSVNNIGESVDRDEKNIMAFAEMSKKFKEWSSLSGITTTGEFKRKTTSPSSLDFLLEPGEDSGPSPNSTPTEGSLSAILPQGRPQFTSGYRTLNRPGHRGVDIGVDANSPVLASQDGKIDNFYRNFGDWGDAIVVKYTDGHTGIYGHVIPNSNLKIGDSVKRGQTIAKVKFWPKGVAGNTLYDDNTHLHYERKTPRGSWINPSPYLNSLTSQSKNTPIKPAQVKPLPPGLSLVHPKREAKRTEGLDASFEKLFEGLQRDRRLNRSSTSGNQSLFIYAVQPIETFVPYPYPVPMKSQSMASTPTPKSASVWRG